MNTLHPVIRREYERCFDKVGKEEPYLGESILGIHEVLRAHFLIADFFTRQTDNPVGLVGPRDIGLLHSALSRQTVSFGGTDKWTRDVEIIATLFYGLIKNHPFHDGNKRTALLCALHHILKCDLTPTAKQRELEGITLSVAEDSLDKFPRYRSYEKRQKADVEVLFLAHWFRNATREVDKKTYTITFNDLQTILNRHGYYLESPHNNHIDIVQYKDVTVFRPFPKKEKKRVRLGQIGFPNWKSQVGQAAIKNVRRVTGLLPENGFDSQTFFHGLDDMQTLIQLYSAPLMRLKDK